MARAPERQSLHVPPPIGHIDDNPAVDDLDIETVDNDTELDGDDFIDIAHELQGFEVNYYTLGRNLHLSRDKLAIIELNNHSSCVTAFGKVIDEWLSMNYTISRFGRPSWQLLVKAVNEIDHERAKVIANKHRIPMDQERTACSASRSDEVLELSDSLNYPPSEGGDIVLNIDTHLRPLKRAVWEARSMWKNIGRSLGLTEGTIHSIHEPDDGEALHRVLTQWIQSGNATIQDLLKTLEDPTVGRSDIANRIRTLRGKDRTDVGL